ncbi:hypothetical protein AINA4_02480 [Aurantimicrobium sp. INA4]|nr:hypothetical protein AINA4_02480 [Aurantimicrobium sp. INA4]
MSVGGAMVKVGGVEGSKEMPALGTALVVKDSKQKTLFSTELWWWTPRNVKGHDLFTRVDLPGYTDWVANLTLKQFVDLNREQIQSYGSELWRFKEDIEAMTAQIRNGAWDDAAITVTLYEWESGYS